MKVILSRPPDLKPLSKRNIWIEYLELSYRDHNLDPLIPQDRDAILEHERYSNIDESFLNDYTDKEIVKEFPSLLEFEWADRRDLLIQARKKMTERDVPKL